MRRTVRRKKTFWRYLICFRNQRAKALGREGGFPHERSRRSPGLRRRACMRLASFFHCGLLRPFERGAHPELPPGADT